MTNLSEIRALKPATAGRPAGSGGRFSDLDPDKLRGGYYTPAELAAWMARWAVRQEGDAVLEPSCGDGSFLSATTDRLFELGTPRDVVAARLRGLEIIEKEAESARSKLRSKIGTAADGVVETGDFFAWFSNPDRPNFDAVVGNPPFIRYQSFPEPHRTRAMEIMVELGMKPNRLTNIWVPFVVAAAAVLKPGGRLALVLPAELLQVTYASQLRSFLADRFERIDVVACNELFFANAEQEVVLLLADGALASPSSSNECCVALTETATVREITEQTPSAILSLAVPKAVRHDSEKWLKYFLTNSEIGLMRELRESQAATTLSTHAQIDVGVVTGKNEFFVVDADRVAQFRLGGHTVPVVSRSVQMKGAVITEEEWGRLSAAGDRVHLLNLKQHNGSKLGKGLENYIRQGEEAGFHSGYKCSIRTPWYAVPSVWVPDGLVFRQIYDFPRVVLNRAGATSTDTIHRMKSHVPAEFLIPNFYTHLTGASAEIEGRSYGGGVLELEPTEAERLLVPAVLRESLPLEEIDRLVRAGRLNEVLEESDRMILMAGMGLTASECAVLKGIWTKMRDRRLARKARKPR